MKLRNLLDKLEYRELVNVDDYSIDVENISYNSKTCRPNDIFVCVVGEHADGHEYFQEAINNGAVVCVVEKILLRQAHGAPRKATTAIPSSRFLDNWGGYTGDGDMGRAVAPHLHNGSPCFCCTSLHLLRSIRVHFADPSGGCRQRHPQLLQGVQCTAHTEQSLCRLPPLGTEIGFQRGDQSHVPRNGR